MTPDDSMELVEMVARASFKNWRDNATAKGLHMDLGMTFEDMSESEREFADRHAAAILTAIEASGRRIVPGWRPMETAPKDGSQFLMLGDPERYGRPIWIDRWWGVNYDGEKVVTPRWEKAGHHNPLASLIGWMPLPSASPKVTEDGTGSPSAPHPARTATEGVL